MSMEYTDLFCEKYRPKNLDDVILSPNLREYFNTILSGDNPIIPNLLLWGHPGGGKTTIARIIKEKLNWDTMILNASETNGIDDIRNTVMRFTSTVSIKGNMKLVILEEADGLSNSVGGMGSSAQELLKNLIETTSSRVRFILLVNNIGKINEAIRSRMQEINVKPPSPDEDNSILLLIAKICISEGIKVPRNRDLKSIVNKYYPDIRKTLQVLQQMSYNEEKTLNYVDDISTRVDSISTDILSRLINSNKVSDTELSKIRQDVISNEKKFDGDYLLLMKSMFELVSKKNTDGNDKQTVFKRVLLLYINEYMIKHTMVVDKEINFYCLLIEILQQKDSIL